MRKEVPLDEVAKYKYLPKAWIPLVLNFIVSPLVSYTFIMWADQFFKADRPWIAIPILMISLWLLLFSIVGVAVRKEFEMGGFELIKKYWQHNVMGYRVLYTEYKEDDAIKAEIIDFPGGPNISRSVIYIKLGGWGERVAQLCDHIHKIPVVRIASIKNHIWRDDYVFVCDRNGSQIRMNIRQVFLFMRMFEKNEWSSNLETKIFLMKDSLDNQTAKYQTLTAELSDAKEAEEYAKGRAEHAINTLIRVSGKIHETKRFVHSKEAEAIQVWLLDELKNMVASMGPGGEIVEQRLAEIADRKARRRRARPVAT